MSISDFLESIGNAPGGPVSIWHAIEDNSWGLGGGVTGDTNERTSWDDLLGGWGSDYAGVRRVGRGVGLAIGAYFAGGAMFGGESGTTAGTAGTGTGGLADMEAGVGLGEGAGGTGASSAMTLADTGISQSAPEALYDAPTLAGSQSYDSAILANSQDPALGGDPGILSKVGNWLGSSDKGDIANRVMAFQGISGMAQNYQAQKAAEEKRKQEMDLATLPQRQKMGNPSVGGAGVNINLRPGRTVLYRADGSPVYIPNGLINSAMNGVRG